MKTPSKSQAHPMNIDPYDSPSLIRNLFTPSKDRIIGPTPQKDGQVLGLFDLLGEDDKTPLKALAGDKEFGARSHSTPRGVNGRLDVPGNEKHSRTPASSSKRHLLDTFATPLKRRHPNEQGALTPSSISKLHFSTPAFLRRDSHRPAMPPIDEDEDHPISPQMVRLPKKPLVRGLSSMLAGLRKMEEEELDDDLEALREMENPDYVPVEKSTSKPVSKDAVLVEDSQVRLPLGGFDDEAMYDSEPEELKNPTLGRDGLPLKIWKKKGQKRTTRRNTMKPVRSKPVPAHDRSAEFLDDDEEELAALQDSQQADANAIPQTQEGETALYGSSRNFDSDSGSEYTASEGGTRYRRPDQTKKRKVVGKDGKIKGAVRKVAASAHANFKRLKLRNSGAKGGPAHNSKFRRKK
jgi:DNA replication regulator SLD2